MKSLKSSTIIAFISLISAARMSGADLVWAGGDAGVWNQTNINWNANNDTNSPTVAFGNGVGLNTADFDMLFSPTTTIQGLVSPQSVTAWNMWNLIISDGGSLQVTENIKLIMANITISSGARLSIGNSLALGDSRNGSSITIANGGVFVMPAHLDLSDFRAMPAANTYTFLNGDLSNVVLPNNINITYDHAIFSNVTYNNGTLTFTAANGQPNPDPGPGPNPNPNPNPPIIPPAIPAPAGSLIWRGSNSAIWGIDKQNNFINATAPNAIANFSDGRTVVFDDTSAIKTVSLANALSPTAVIVTTNDAYVFQGAGSITGRATLTKNGTGTLTLASNNTYTGDTVINAGSIIVSAARGLGVSEVTIEAAGILELKNDSVTTAVTYENFITGPGTLLKSGSGTITLGNADATLHRNIKAGTLVVSDGGSDDILNNLTVGKGAVLQVIMTSDRSLDQGIVAGQGTVQFSGPHNVNLTGTHPGITIGLVKGATLVLAQGLIADGISGDAGSRVSLAGDTTINQLSDGVFQGSFTGVQGAALTITGGGVLTLAGNPARQASLGAITVAAGGALRVNAENTKAILDNGILYITSTANGSVRYNTAITGTGGVVLESETIGGKLSLGDGINSGTTAHPYELQTTGTLVIGSGTIGGVFKTRNNLIVAPGATLSPGNSPGTVTVNGNFAMAADSNLRIEVNVTTSDKVIVTGSANIAGSLTIAQDATSVFSPSSGQKFTILTAANGITGGFANASAGGIILVAPADQAALSVRRFHVQNDGTSLSITAITSMSQVTGFTPHEGVSEFISLIDSGRAPSHVQNAADSAWGASAGTVINNLTPLGYAAEYAMARDADTRMIRLLHDRQQERNYDRASLVTAAESPWEAFAVADLSNVKNKEESDTAIFDYQSRGGLAGLAKKLDETTAVGAAASYDNGTATLHGGGGKLNMDRAGLSVFLSKHVSRDFYFNVGASGGMGLYDTARKTSLGALSSDNTGYSFGLNAEAGTVVPLSNGLYLTPYVGISYAHYEFDGAVEQGNMSALNVAGWSNDSTQLKAGTGLNRAFTAWGVPLRAGVDFFVLHELSDTDSELNASFVAGGPGFKTQAAALPTTSIGISPSLAVQCTETTSFTVSYDYQGITGSQTYQSVNLAIRTRF